MGLSYVRVMVLWDYLRKDICRKDDYCSIFLLQTFSKGMLNFSPVKGNIIIMFDYLVNWGSHIKHKSRELSSALILEAVLAGSCPLCWEVICFISCFFFLKKYTYINLKNS